jgi:hypothetical protein
MANNPQLIPGGFANSSNVRNEHANRFINLNYIIALIEDRCKKSIYKLPDFLIKILCD